MASAALKAGIVFSGKCFLTPRCANIFVVMGPPCYKNAGEVILSGVDRASRTVNRLRLFNSTEPVSGVQQRFFHNFRIVRCYFTVSHKERA